MKSLTFSYTHLDVYKRQIYGHPMGAEAGAKAILQAIEAVMAGEAVKDAANTHAELDAALKFWAK